MLMKGLRQRGQSMVEFTVMLAFGVMLLTSRGGDSMMELLGVIHDKYRGHSYAMSLSDLPSHGTYSQYESFVDKTVFDATQSLAILKKFKKLPSFDDVIEQAGATVGIPGLPTGGLETIEKTMLEGVPNLSL